MSDALQHLFKISHDNLFNSGICQSTNVSIVAINQYGTNKKCRSEVIDTFYIYLMVKLWL